MDQSTKMAPQTSLFQVYLRLRPPTESLPPKEHSEQWLIVEPPLQTATNEENCTMSSNSTHVTLQPPNDSRKRAVERFNFTKIFKEEATQLDIFEGTGAINAVRSLIEDGRDGLLATLGVTGSGKVQLLSRVSEIEADNLVESYDTGLSKSARTDADDIGRFISIYWPKNSSGRTPRPAV